MMTTHPRVSVDLEEFKERVRLGDVRDRYGNRFCIYPPSNDTFFSCLSYAQWGNDSHRMAIREQLLVAFIERVTGSQCYNLEQWRRCNDATSFAVCASALSDPAIRSLAITVATVSDEELAEYILTSTEFRDEVIRFIEFNVEQGALYCRHVFAYLYCAVCDSDVIFYRASNDGGEVQIEHEIAKVDGCAISVTHVRSHADGVMWEPDTPRQQQDADDDDGTNSDSDSVNWHTTYLLYITATSDGTGRFELLYTPSINAGDQQIRRQQRYQLRTCYVDGDRGRVNSEPYVGHPAVMTAPPRGWKVHSYLLSPGELYPDRIYQVNGADARGLTAAYRIPESRSMFIYLYYRDVGGQPMAVFVSTVAGGLAPEAPLFVINDEQAGVADGVLVAVTRNAQHAHRHVQLETHSSVLLPH